MTIEISAAIVPLIITIVAIWWSFWVVPEGGGSYSFNGLVFLASFPTAIAVSLLAWLIWALAA